MTTPTAKMDGPLSEKTSSRPCATHTAGNAPSTAPEGWTGRDSTRPIERWRRRRAIRNWVTDVPRLGSNEDRAEAYREGHLRRGRAAWPPDRTRRKRVTRRPRRQEEQGSIAESTGPVHDS